MRTLVTALFVMMTVTALSQISVRCMSAKRTSYQRGDTIRVMLVMRLNPQSCLEGMKKTYVYLSGCEELSRFSWRQLPNKIFEKEMVLRISDNARGKAKITVTRDTDKDSFFRQEVFNIK